MVLEEEHVVEPPLGATALGQLPRAVPHPPLPLWVLSWRGNRVKSSVQYNEAYMQSWQRWPIPGWWVPACSLDGSYLLLPPPSRSAITDLFLI